MKKLILFLIISLLYVYPVFSNILNDSTHFIYVSINGDDNTANGSMTQPFRNIQSAINYSSDGDIVVVLEGRYSGPDNRNLNFNSKSITIQSEFPDDNTCLNNTIIDAEGIGFVIRFINDEGTNCVFQGFSIVLGDTTLIPIKGIPGFIEFSKKANPVTKRLKIISIDSMKLKCKSGQKLLKSTTANDEGICLNNPYVQPINTTDYYGSGDVDKDGQLTDNDLLKVDSIINGYISPNIRADVNGNGIIDNNDFSLIDSAINYNKILPAWWNQLTTEDEKNKWIDSIIKIDKTDQLDYILGTFQCYHFAKQIFINAFEKYFYLKSNFDGSQTQYNLPIFQVSINGENFSPGHAINAILIGSNPLNFNDWRFIESQADYNVSPGMWDMPYNTYVSIVHDAETFEQINFYTGWVTFYVDENGWEIESVDSAFLSNQHNSQDNNNYPYCYNPRILPNEDGFILYEKQRDDMTRIMDIHISKGPDQTDIPITHFDHYSRILDVKKVDSVNFQVLWESKTNDNIGKVYYGVFNLDSLKLSDTIKVVNYESDWPPIFGKLIIDSFDNSNAFWYNQGIWETKKVLNTWNVPIKIVDGYLNSPFSYSVRKSFDVINYQNDSLVLAYINSSESKLELLKKIGDNWEYLPSILSWEYYEDIPEELTFIVDLSGVFHIVYKTYICCSTYKLFHIHSSDLLNWSNPVQIDAGSSIQNPSLLQTIDNKLVFSYEKAKNNQIVPVWRRFSNDIWSEPHYISVRQGANATYTDSYINPNNQLILAWAAQAKDSLKIESFLVEDINIPDSNPETGIELRNSFKSDSFKIYPNPASNKVIIESEVVIASKISISVFDLSGRIVFNNELNVNNQKLYYSLDLSKFNSGLYFIKLQDKEYFQISKLVIE